MRRAAASLIVVLGIAACGGDAGPDPSAAPSDFQVDYHWDSGISNVGPDYLSVRISLEASGSGLIHATLGHPSSDTQDEWVETFGVTAEALESLYAKMQEVGLFTRTWQQGEPVPGSSGGPSVQVVADGIEYRIPSGLADPNDVARAGKVYDQITGVVPTTVLDALDVRQAQYLAEHG